MDYVWIKCRHLGKVKKVDSKAWLSYTKNIITGVDYCKEGAITHSALVHIWKILVCIIGFGGEPQNPRGEISPNLARASS